MTASAVVDGRPVEWNGKEWVTVLRCPDCNEEMVKTWIECEDGSGWYCGWLCGCKRNRGYVITQPLNTTDTVTMQGD